MKNITWELLYVKIHLNKDQKDTNLHYRTNFTLIISNYYNCVSEANNNCLGFIIPYFCDPSIWEHSNNTWEGSDLQGLKSFNAFGRKNSYPSSGFCFSKTFYFLLIWHFKALYAWRGVWKVLKRVMYYLLGLLDDFWKLLNLFIFFKGCKHQELLQFQVGVPEEKQEGWEWRGATMSKNNWLKIHVQVSLIICSIKYILT